METKLLNPITFYLVNLANATKRSCVQRISDKNNRNNGARSEKT
jgi:hypothetical protein